MDARTSGNSIDQPPSLRRWLAKERANGRFYRVAELVAALVLVSMFALSFTLLRGGDQESTLSPPVAALLLVGNLIPAIVLMVLFSRRRALRRAEEGGLGTGLLHTRLVALFSVIAATPTVLVAIFASVLFQSGMEFWFSDRARTVLQQAERTSSIYESEHRNRLRADLEAMGIDMVRAINQFGAGSQNFTTVFIYQIATRQLRESAVLTAVGNQWNTQAVINYDDRPIQQRFSPAEVKDLKAGQVAIKIATPDRVEGIIRLDPDVPVYLYGARDINAAAVQALGEAKTAASGYKATLERARGLQLRFNAALLLGSLIIVGLSILGALKLADRLVRPVGALVNAAGRVEEGDFSTRVPIQKSDDEIGVLAAAFNRMTGRLEEQTGALKAANTQLDTRRAFIEAVLGSVTAGVIAIDQDRNVLLLNRSAGTLLEHGGEAAEGRALSDLSTELDEFLSGDQREADVMVRSEHGQRTLAVKRVRYSDGTVLTFDDITDQLADQRRAAWSDIARRIAHEIKNPLTPIQLAAERLQRRYGKEVQTEPETFGRLTETIIRQVGDLRRMVDEFSNFARMPKPVFREENVHDVARTSLFLHEVAHPGVSFALDPPSGDIRMICDRRQLSQALTNVVKNAVEAIEARRNRGEHSLEGDRVKLTICDSEAQLVIDVTDTGIGLPEDRERLTEPYMTTRVRGTGLGLAIVKKIVEEHGGDIAFLDRSGGGTHVRIAFDKSRLKLLAEAAQAAEDEPGLVRNEES
ncbi:ATP-binding protein [Sphingomonas sp. KRR8]|uniref:sensor histidine kinase NtrY-like n=1 Tax=Sphingomonas sp. KRR8 TaxID=2942996 RepID=UPI0020213C74|nr:ATP-binding protein [Sphingomonas sp. KRR8]URD61565.1 ATP-binding protein [Sphingomonas sp. KRR8]